MLQGFFGVCCPIVNITATIATLSTTSLLLLLLWLFTFLLHSYDDYNLRIFNLHSPLISKHKSFEKLSHEVFVLDAMP